MRNPNGLKIQLEFKRILIVVGAIFLSISIGSSVKYAFAGQDINSLLSNWFNSKKTESIQKIDEAIATEKDLLMIELKSVIQAEIQIAEDDLAQFTQEEIERRINNLRDFAEELLSKLTIDIAEDKKEVSSHLNTIIEQALEQMEAVTTNVGNSDKTTGGESSDGN